MLTLKCKEVYDLIESKWYNVFYVWLYGSQNYNLDTPSSDFDFKVLIIPSLEDLVRKQKPLSTMYEFEWWQVEVKDIRNYIESAVKVNINFLEILSTNYFWSDDYDLAEQMRSFFVPLTKNQWCQYLRATHWMMMQKFHALRHPFPSKVDVIAKFGYDPKQLCHIQRLSFEIFDYCNWKTPDFWIDWDERDLLIWLKEWKVPDSAVDSYVESILQCTQVVMDKYLSEHKDSFETKGQMIRFSQDLIINYIIWSLK